MSKNCSRCEAEYGGVHAEETVQFVSYPDNKRGRLCPKCKLDFMEFLTEVDA